MRNDEVKVKTLEGGLSRRRQSRNASSEEPRGLTKCGLEAPGGFEPPHRSFADCSLTTWVRRLGKRHYSRFLFVNTT